MSILSGFKRFKRYTKTSEGYIPSYEKTIASAVCFGDGTDDTNTVEAKLGAIKGITTSTSVTETGYAADATVINQLNSNLQDCFQSVSNGKALVASAITDKGISTASDAAFNTLATNIASIVTKTGIKRSSLVAYSHWCNTTYTSAGIWGNLRALYNGYLIIVIATLGNSGANSDSWAIHCPNGTVSLAYNANSATDGWNIGVFPCSAGNGIWASGAGRCDHFGAAINVEI